MTTQYLTGATFDEVVHASSVPVVVTFTARWCSACALFAPVLERLAADEEGRLVVAKVDVDDDRVLSDRYEVMAMPTTLLLVDGDVRLRLIGARSRSQLARELAGSLAPAR